MKRALQIIGIVIVVLIVIAIALPFVINVNTFRPQIESQLSSVLGRQVKIGNLHLSIITGSVSADNVSISDDPSFSSSPFIRANSLKVGVRVIPLVFSKSLQVTDLTLDQPQVTLLRAPSGVWNFSSLGHGSSEHGSSEHGSSEHGSNEQNAPSSTTPAKSGAPAPAAKPATTAAQPAAAGSTSSSSGFQQNLSVGSLNINNGSVSIGDTKAPSKAHVYKNVNIKVSNFSFSSQFPFSLTADLPGGGSLSLTGTAGPVDAADAAATPLSAQISVKQFDVAKSGFIDPSSGLGAVADFNGTVTSNGKQANSSGTATVSRLKLAPHGSPATQPVQMKYAVNYGLQNQIADLTQGDVSIGKAVAKLAGTADLRGDDILLNMKLNGENMPVNDLEAMLPALAVTLPAGSSLQGGTVTANLTITGSADHPVIAGPLKLANTKLAGFNLGSKMSAISKLTGGSGGGPDTTIQNFSANARYAPNGIQTQNINLTVPSLGTLTGNGTISPAGALDYTMAADLSGTAVTGLAQMAGMSGKGGSIPFFIRGTTSDPKFLPDVNGMLKRGLASQINSRIGGDQGNSIVKGLSGLFHKKSK